MRKNERVELRYLPPSGRFFLPSEAPYLLYSVEYCTYEMVSDYYLGKQDYLPTRIGYVHYFVSGMVCM